MSNVSPRELAALAHDCPTCRAKPNEPCKLVMLAGRRSGPRRPHPERLALTKARP